MPSRPGALTVPGRGMVLLVLALSLAGLPGCMTSSLVRTTFGGGDSLGLATRPVALTGAQPLAGAPGALPPGEGLLVRLVYDDGSFATAAVPFETSAVLLAPPPPAATLPAQGAALEPGRWLEVAPWLVAFDAAGAQLLVRLPDGAERPHPLPLAVRRVEPSAWLYWVRVAFFPIVLPLTVCFDGVTLPIQGIWAASSDDGLDALLEPRAAPPQLP